MWHISEVFSTYSREMYEWPYSLAASASGTHRGCACTKQSIPALPKIPSKEVVIMRGSFHPHQQLLLVGDGQRKQSDLVVDIKRGKRENSNGLPTYMC